LEKKLPLITRNKTKLLISKRFKNGSKSQRNSDGVENKSIDGAQYTKISDSLIKLLAVWIPLVTLISGGYVYWAQGRHEKELAIEALTLANAQAIKLATIEFETKKITLEQQRVAFKLAEIAADSERERSQLSLEGQKLSIEQTKAAAKYQLDKERLSSSLMEIEQGIKRVEFANDTQSRISENSTLRISCLPGVNSYSVSLDTVIKNSSDKKSVEVSWELRSAYLGVPRESNPNPILDISRINEPPDAYTATESKGPIRWESFGQVGYTYPGTKALTELKKTQFYFKDGGMLTKLIRPKDISQSNTIYLVSAPPGHWVAIVIRVGLDGATAGNDLFRYAKWERLPVCESVTR
jgi:hypothetical protein